MPQPLVVPGPVVIEDEVWLGQGVCVMPNVSIGKHSVVGSNSVVTKDIWITIPSFSMAWIMELADHHLYSGDIELVRKGLPTVQKMLGVYLDSMVDGLLPLPQGKMFWHFYEWADGMQSDLPRYLQVKRSVKQYIDRHGLRPGDKIPTEAELCRQLGWGRVTINRAMKELSMEGLLDRVQGSGTYVAKPRDEDSQTYRILVSSTNTKDTDDYIGPLFAGIREEAAARELNIAYYTKHAVPNAAAVEKMGVNGVLSVAYQLDDQPPLLELHNAGIPVVDLAQQSRVGSLPVISTDNYNGVSEIVTYLLMLGHRRIAYITPGVGSSDVHERCMAFNNTLCSAGLPIDPAYLLLTVSSMNQTYLEHWFDTQSVPPTAIILGGRQSGAVLGLLAKRGLNVPRDMSIVAIDDIDSTNALSPSLTALYQPVREMGRRGLAKLISMIRGEDDGSPETLPTRLIVRESVAPPKDPSGGNGSSVRSDINTVLTRVQR